MPDVERDFQDQVQILADMADAALDEAADVLAQAGLSKADATAVATKIALVRQQSMDLPPGEQAAIASGVLAGKSLDAGKAREVIAGKISPKGSLRTPSYKTATNLMATLDAVLDQFQAETLQEEARQK